MKKNTPDIQNLLKQKKKKPVVKKFKDVPDFDRPREKMVARGVKSLSNLELIAAMLVTGSRGRDVFQIAADIVKVSEKSFNRMSLESLTTVPGVGVAKACRIMAAVEFSRRFLLREGVRIRSDKDIIPLVAEVADKKQEYFLTLTIDGANQLIQKRTVFIGTVNQSLIHPREIFADAVADRAAGIVLVHNHPSGICAPSQEDFNVTDRMLKAGKIMGIDIMDHIIITKDDYYSFQRSGYLNPMKRR